MRYTIIILITQFFSPLAFSQRCLEVGAICPDISFSRFQHGTVVEDRLSNYSGKYIIIDFWKTYCGSCVAGLATMEKLQSQWPDKLKVIPVNDQETALVQKFWNSNAVTKVLKMGTAVGDNMFGTLFKHKIVPHYVILGPDRKIIAITFKEYVNEKNIGALIDGDTPYFEPKFESDDVRVDASTDTSELVVENKNGDLLLGKSMLTGYTPGVPNSKGRLQLDTVAEQVTLRVNNNSIPDLVRFTIEDDELRKFRKRQIYLKIDSSVLYVNARKEVYKKEWDKKHLYCYALSFNKGKPISEALDKMKSDLAFYLDLNISIQDSLMDVWILKSNNHDSKGRKGNLTSNISLVSLLNLMNGDGTLPNVFDETDLPPELILDRTKIPAMTSDLKEMNKKLASLGLFLVEAKRRVTVLVVR